MADSCVSIPRGHEATFAVLAEQARACRACPSMAGRVPVLSRANGNPAARVLFVAEAPGRRGAEVSRVPLSRDQTGRRFERLLALAGLRRDEVFITNAVLCNPRDARGNNRPPSPAERRACAHWLAETVALIQPAVVVPLGAVALAALGSIEAHGLRLRDGAGLPVAWRGGWLLPLYHPSPRAGLSRSYAQQDEDFRRLGDWLRAAGLLAPFAPPSNPAYDESAG